MIDGERGYEFSVKDEQERCVEFAEYFVEPIVGSLDGPMNFGIVECY